MKALRGSCSFGGEENQRYDGVEEEGGSCGALFVLENTQKGGLEVEQPHVHGGNAQAHHTGVSSSSVVDRGH